MLMVSNRPDNIQAFRVGDYVRVRSFKEIVQTLDESGALDGLPFMPEMAEHCGRRFRLSSRALKACVERLVDGRAYIDIHEFRRRDVWVLDDLRCNGRYHDGCQRACLLFWKAAWLQSADNDSSPRSDASIREDPSGARELKTRVPPDRYFCQSTQLANATRVLTVWGRLRLCVTDVRVGNSSVVDMCLAIVRPIFWKTIYRFVSPNVPGRLKRTPTVHLGLQPGDYVKVKSSSDIAETLDEQGRNRGLLFGRGLNVFCGKQFQVRDRLERMIVESTGRMIPVKDTVSLKETNCVCSRHAVGGCPRREPAYWREIWLNKVDG